MGRLGGGPDDERADERASSDRGIAAVSELPSGVIGLDGRVSMPWLAPLLQRGLAPPMAHALLLHGPEGVGQFALAVALAQAGLCESAEAHGPPDARPCGRCAACRLVQARSHPDLRVIVPEALGTALGWADESEAAAERSGKAKPSREIKVEAVRAAVGFAQTTSARGRGKTVVLHPAERMNAIAANTLLKTLEEPPGDVRFILVTSAPDQLLPTVRSRCRSFALGLPAPEQAVAWLAERKVADAAALLEASGGQPEAALALAVDGIDAATWRRLPAAVASGDAAALSTWPLPRAIDALQKLCHDLACVAAGGAPRYFPAAALPGADLADVQVWSEALMRAARDADHPWNAGLMVESLVLQGRQAIVAAPGLPASSGRSRSTPWR